MEIIEPQVVIEQLLLRGEIYPKLERCGRTAYKSEDKITTGSAEKFINTIIRSGHESVLEHVNITVRFICDRGVTHELVRHRLAAYTQESTRYVNYAKRDMQFIRPCFWEEGSPKYALWRSVMEKAESAYLNFIAIGVTPQQARSVLPNSLKTEIVATMNIREWRHVLRLRTHKSAHPQMRQVMDMVLDKFKHALPILFEDINPT